MIKTLKPRVTVDLGFDRGLSTIAFAYENSGLTFGIDWLDCKSYSEKIIALDDAFENISLAIRLNYVKNLHLIVGPFAEVSKKWTREIDLLHIDWTHHYTDAKAQYETWKRFLKDDAVFLIHDVESCAGETGRFFRELPLPKMLFPGSNGLGIATRNTDLLASIAREWTDAVNFL
jgi:hypothetical protein